jgi:hypothetical protein
MNERRTTRRRRMPFVRSAILEVGGKSHIVAVTDLSAEGAFVAMRVPVDAKAPITLRLVVPRDGRVIGVSCQLVRQTERFDAETGRPAGLALRFKGLDAAAIRRIEEFAMEGFLPSVDPTPQEHFEYRTLERSAIDVNELNQLGLDGWRLAAALPHEKGSQLVLVRKL